MNCQIAYRAYEQRVTIGRGLGDNFSADDTARPRTVIDDDLLPQRICKLVGNGTCDEIRRAASPIRNDQSYRAGREGLRMRHCHDCC